MHLGLDLPESLLARLDPASVGDVGRGRLSNRLIRVVDRLAGPAYLKVAKGSTAAVDLRSEADRLRWIAGRLPVPDVLFFEEGEVTCLLLTEVPGAPAHARIDDLGPTAVLAMLAETLREIHELPIEDCPFDGLFDLEIRRAERRLLEGLVDEAQFVDTVGQAPGETLEWLRKRRNLLTDAVFTHGDFCMPNVMIDEGRVSGVLDWGLAGVADRHRDFMSVQVTLRRNLGPEWAAPFHEMYGEVEVDQQRVELYSVLNLYFRSRVR